MLCAGIPMATSGEKPKSKKPAEGSKKPGSSPSPTARRQQKQREERLALIKEQVADGTLTIRQMTPKERRENPPRPPKSKKKR
jgi:hypothetical protein